MNPSGTLDGTFNATYAYDASNRLVDYNGSQSLRLRFGYDPSGNRTSRREANRTAVQSTFVNGTNRISQLKQGTTVLRSFDYDGAGNMVSDRHAPSGVTTAYVYNRANRLRQLKQGNAVQGTYIYNAFGQMVRRVAGGETTLYLHDLDGNVISEVDGSGTVRRDYVWVEHRGTSSATQAPGTALPLVQVTGLDTPGQEIAWIHTDHQNRQVILTNATGGLVRTVVTTPFGMLAKDSGQTVHQTSAGFAGQWKLPEAGTNGIQYNWHRHYDPTLGRYTQPDPLGLIDGPSRYGYALQNPVAFEDPRGERIAPMSPWNGSGSPTPNSPQTCGSVLDCDQAYNACTANRPMSHSVTCYEQWKLCKQGLGIIVGPGLGGNNRRWFLE